MTFTISSVSLSSDEGQDIRDVAHPLLPHWVFWVWQTPTDQNKEVSMKNWKTYLHRLFTVKSIEHFIALQHRLVPPSRLTPEFQFMYFKNGIEPHYEDEKNAKGGVWYVDVEHRYKIGKLDKVWSELLIAVLGSQFGNYHAYVNGAILKQRSDTYRIELWISDSTSRHVNYEIRDILCEKLGIVCPDSVVFRRHIISQRIPAEFR